MLLSFVLAATVIIAASLFIVGRKLPDAFPIVRPLYCNVFGWHSFTRGRWRQRKHCRWCGYSPSMRRNS